MEGMLCTLTALTSSHSHTHLSLVKVVEETHFEFTGHTAPVECARLVDDETFVSGSQDGSVALWTSNKKKPVELIPVSSSPSPLYRFLIYSRMHMVVVNTGSHHSLSLAVVISWHLDPITVLSLPPPHLSPRPH